MTDRALALLCPLALTFALLAPVRAQEEEAPDPAVALVQRLEELRKAEDASGLQEAIGQVPDVYKGTEDQGLRGKLRAELGKVLKDEDMGPAREVAVQALVALDDPKNVWKELSKAMPNPKVEEATAVDLAVVKAVGDIAESKAIKDLLELAGKAKDADLSKAAVEALGGFHDDKKVRVGVLEELMDLGKLLRPGQSTQKSVSKEAQDRWALVGPALVGALNRLTGQNVATYEDWEALWKDYKKTPKDLFRDDE